MEDLSLHILDIAENAIRAEATRIEIILTKDDGHDLLTLEIRDNGKGMDSETLARIRDPFFTTKQKKTGLGIPLLAQTAEQTGGRVEIESAPGKGTVVTATFGWCHVDRPQLGDVASTVVTLIAGHGADVDILYEEQTGSGLHRIDTADLKRELESVPITDPAVLDAVRETLKTEFTLMNEVPSNVMR
ncbi:MAG: sensor histidine kinase [Nitrospiraceae bacterium]|nr:sensor histidine kinase [Nitrospiraceae bacterium]